jgi:hypothetical protein
MANLILKTDGNLSSVSTFASVDTTSTQTSGGSSAAVTTSFQTSSTFTPGAITIDGIAIWTFDVPGSTGTITVALDQAGGTVTGTSVTANVTDLQPYTWNFFKFGGSVTLLAATAYSG